jgi:hypothetical protein
MYEDPLLSPVLFIRNIRLWYAGKAEKYLT